MLCPSVDDYDAVVAVIGFVRMSGLSVSVVYAQELLPGNVGLASGLITGLAFGMGALGGVVLGNVGYYYGSMAPVIRACSYLPLFGLLAFMLPKDRRPIAETHRKVPLHAGPAK